MKANDPQPSAGPQPLPAWTARLRVKIAWPVLAAGGALAEFLRRGWRPEICFETEDLVRTSAEAYAPVAHALAEAGLVPTFHAPFMYIDPGSDLPDQRREAEVALELTAEAARHLRPEVVVCHGGGLYRVPLDERRRWSRVARPLFRDLAARLASECGARLVLENVVDSDPEPLAELLADLAPQDVGWCYDVGHQHLFDRHGAPHWIATLGPFLRHMHLHDNHGRQDDHLPPGQGRIDFATLFQHLAPYPEPSATLEVPWRDGVPQSLATLGPVWPWGGRG
ncbi:MAG: sugar phosphate isomerase/epimerase family protein [Desulfovibrionaceae bacterium]